MGRLSPFRGLRRECLVTLVALPPIVTFTVIHGRTQEPVYPPVSGVAQDPPPTTWHTP